MRSTVCLFNYKIYLNKLEVTLHCRGFIFLNRKKIILINAFPLKKTVDTQTYRLLKTTSAPLSEFVLIFKTPAPPPYARASFVDNP